MDFRNKTHREYAVPYLKESTMKTLFNETKNGMTARATEFSDLHAAFAFMKEKKKQGYIASIPDKNGDKFIVYTWRKE